MGPKKKSPINEEDTEEIPITQIEVNCTYKLCDKKYFPCRSNTPGPTTYNPKLPRKHIAGAPFTKLSPRKTEIVPPYEVGPASYNTHMYKSIKPVLETHNVKLKTGSSIIKAFNMPQQGSMSGYIYSHRYRRSLMKTLIDSAPVDGYATYELVRDGAKVDIVRHGEREQVVEMRKILAQTRPTKNTVFYEPPLF